MPLLFYFPLIVWMGMMGIVQQEMHAPVKSGRSPGNDNAVRLFRPA